MPVEQLQSEERYHIIAILNINKRKKMTDDNSVDKSFENEVTPSPMVHIPLKEYDKLKEQTKYITDPSLISVIDKIEELVRALRKHIVRKEL